MASFSDRNTVALRNGPCCSGGTGEGGGLDDVDVG